jgi:hypothetical protein
VDQEKGSATLMVAGPAGPVFAVLADPSGTEVTLTYDWSAGPQFVRDRGIQFPPFGPEHLTNSLHHLAKLATPAPRP